MKASRQLRAFIVVDLGFGDSGKGLLTDFLVRRTSAGLVVRFNGGAQAGHRVIAPDGRSHTFAQFGAGTLAGGRTFLSRHVLVHPTALLREGAALEQSGVREVFSRIAISENARLITPFHQAANRLREMIRGVIQTTRLSQAIFGIRLVCAGKCNGCTSASGSRCASCAALLRGRSLTLSSAFSSERILSISGSKRPRDWVRSASSRRTRGWASGWEIVARWYSRELRECCSTRGADFTRTRPGPAARSTTRSSC